VLEEMMPSVLITLERAQVIESFLPDSRR
jgi:hypothetical protein